MIRSILIGLLLAVGIGVLVFVLGARTHVVTGYLAPGIFIAGFLSPAIPTRVVYWIDPEGGAPAFLVIVMACALLFWSAVFGTFHYVRAHRRAK